MANHLFTEIIKMVYRSWIKGQWRFFSPSQIVKTFTKGQHKGKSLVAFIDGKAIADKIETVNTDKVIDYITKK